MPSERYISHISVFNNFWEGFRKFDNHVLITIFISLICAALSPFAPFDASALGQGFDLNSERQGLLNDRYRTLEELNRIVGNNPNMEVYMVFMDKNGEVHYINDDLKLQTSLAAAFAAMVVDLRDRRDVHAVGFVIIPISRVPGGLNTICLTTDNLAFACTNF